MPESELRLIKKCAEKCEMDEIKMIPSGTRGIYALLKNNKRKNKYDVVYVGMTNRSIKGRLSAHRRRMAKGKIGIWTHFSLYEVWDNIKKEEIEELE